MYSLGERSVSPGSPLRLCRHEEIFSPCSDDISLSWRKFLQTFHLEAGERHRELQHRGRERMAGNFHVLECRSLDA